jgi:hypothetical protein
MPPFGDVNITITDGALGAVTPSADSTSVCMGCSSQGPTAQMLLTTSLKTLQTTFGAGPMVEAAAFRIFNSGAPVIAMRTPPTNPGTSSAVTFVGTGTSVITVTVDGTVGAYDDSSTIFQVITGGTRGTAGIVFRYSRDKGRTWSAQIALGTASTYLIPNSGITLHFAAGTLVAGDTASFYTIAPLWAIADIAACFAALSASTQEWSFAHVVGTATESDSLAVDGYMANLAIAYRYAFAITEARDVAPDGSETEAQWITSIETAYAPFSSVRVGVAAGMALLRSPLTQQLNRRNAAWTIATRAVSAAVHVDLARTLDGKLVNTSFPDPTLLPIDTDVYHDERVTPGLDAARFMTLRTYIGKGGVFVKNGNLMAPNGSDFTLVQYRRVMDLACRTTYAFFLDQLSNNVRLDKVTGYILEKDAATLQKDGSLQLKTVLVDAAHASNAYCVIARNDNLSSTKTLHTTVRVQPLGYLKDIEVDMALANPVAA